MNRVLVMLLVVLCTNCDERTVNKEGSPVIIGSGGRILTEESVAAALASSATTEVNIAPHATAENSAKPDDDEDKSIELERQREETRERITDSAELRRVKPLRCAMPRLNYLDGDQIFYDMSRHVTVEFDLDNAVYPVVDEDDLMAKILVRRSSSTATWDYVYVWKMDLTADPMQTHAYRDFVNDCDGGTELRIPSEVPALCPEKFAKAPPEQ